jgi:hypothetical protein
MIPLPNIPLPVLPFLVAAGRVARSAALRDLSRTAFEHAASAPGVDSNSRSLFLFIRRY